MLLSKGCAKVLSFFCVFVLVGCNQPKNAKEFFNYYSSFNRSSYIEVTEGGMRYLLQYRPAEFLVLNSLKGSKVINEDLVQNSISDYNEYMHFCLRFMRIDSGNVMEYNLRHKGEYYDRLARISSGMEPLIKAVSSRDDTLYSVFHHYERSYNLRPFEQVLFSMPKNTEHIPDKIIFDDQLFSGAKIEFKNFQNLFFNQPQLRL